MSIEDKYHEYLRNDTCSNPMQFKEWQKYFGKQLLDSINYRYSEVTNNEIEIATKIYEKYAQTQQGNSSRPVWVKQKEKLEDRLFELGEMNKPPCFCCGYNGVGYYQPETHPCAERHHRLYRHESPSTEYVEREHSGVDFYKTPKEIHDLYLKQKQRADEFKQEIQRLKEENVALTKLLYDRDKENSTSFKF